MRTIHKKINFLFLLLLLPALLFANYSYDVRSVRANSYISVHDLPMFTLVGNSLKIRDFTKDDVLFNEILNILKADVKIKSASVEKALNDRQKKALAIGLLRLVLKNPDYVYCDSLVDFSSEDVKKHPAHIPEHKSSRQFILSVAGVEYPIDLVYGRCFIKITVPKNLSSSENALAFCEGSYISKEFCRLIKSFFIKDDISIISEKSTYDTLFAPMTSYSEEELVKIFDFAQSFFNQEVFVAPADGSVSNVEKYFKASLKGKKLIPLTKAEKIELLLSMVRSVFVTDSLASYRVNPVDGSKEFALHFHKGYRFYFLYNDKKSAFSLEYDLKPETYRNAPASVLVKIYEIENKTELRELEEGIFPPLFNSPDTFCGQFSYFSPELLSSLIKMKEKYLGASVGK